MSVSEGKLVQRVSDEVVLDGSEDWALYQELTNTIRFRVAINNSKSSRGDTDTAIANIFPQIDVIGSSDVEGFCINAGLLYVGILKTKLGTPNVANFKTWLQANPITLTYQLAEPVEVPVETSGTLLSYPSGTIYAEPAVADAGIYTNKMTVLNQTLPIHTLEKISKIDFATGLETSIDTATAVIASDKKSFAHPSLASGDIVFFTYFYDSTTTTQGETSITYYDSRHTLKDTVTGKFYKVVPTVANGVLTNGLVEV